jgi:uncharacterized protein
MRIEIDSDDDSGARFSQTYDGGELDFDQSELRLIEPVKVKGQVLRKSGEVELRGELQTKTAIPCSRCLKEVELPIAVNFAERFATAAAWQGEEQHELSEDDLDLGVVDGAVELDDLVKEEILLALPAQVLCEENCKGICPNCGADRNVAECRCETQQVDARWEKLKDLRF